MLRVIGLLFGDEHEMFPLTTPQPKPNLPYLSFFFVLIHLERTKNGLVKP